MRSTQMATTNFTTNPEKLQAKETSKTESQRAIGKPISPMETSNLKAIGLTIN